jgi:hypothetical protein
MKTARCPSCGAPVAFRSATSIYVVCEFCRSTLLRSGEDLQNLGRMAELLEDRSPIQIGSTGTFRKHPFTVIGRIQLQYEAGIWNEWHLLFDDGRTAWLAEAAGEWLVSAQVAVSDPLPAFAALVPEMPVILDGRTFTVSNLVTARCISGQGELPFKVAAGYDVHTADLRGNDRFLTIDYSETPPLVFVGQAVAFADLKLANLKEPDDPAAGAAPQVARAPSIARTVRRRCAFIRQPSKASPATVADRSSASTTRTSNCWPRPRRRCAKCPGCRSAARASWGSDWEVIGFMRRSTTRRARYGVVGIPVVQRAAGFRLADRRSGTLELCAHTFQPTARSAAGRRSSSIKGHEFKLFNMARPK